jgi:hypothetical protein
MMIDASEPQILEWLGAHGSENLLARRLGLELAPCDLLEQNLELFV